MSTYNLAANTRNRSFSRVKKGGKATYIVAPPKDHSNKFKNAGYFQKQTRIANQKLKQILEKLLCLEQAKGNTVNSFFLFSQGNGKLLDDKNYTKHTIK